MISHPHTFPFVFTHGKIITCFLPAVRRQASEDRAAAAVRPAPACALAFMQQGNGTALRCVPQTPPLCGARLRGRTRRRFLRTAVFVSAFSKTISQLTFFRIYVTILLVLPMVTSVNLGFLVYVFTIHVRLHKGTPVFLMQISQGQGVSITPLELLYLVAHCQQLHKVSHGNSFRLDISHKRASVSRPVLSLFPGALRKETLAVQYFTREKGSVCEQSSHTLPDRR